MTALAEEIEGLWPRGANPALQVPVRIEADEEGKVAALWTQPQIISLYGGMVAPRPPRPRRRSSAFPATM